MFVLISAELFAGQDIKQPIRWLRHRCNKILLPYYTYLFLVVIVGLFAGKSVEPWGGVFRYLTVSQGFGFSSAKFAPEHSLGHLWFITYILFVYLLTPFLQKIISQIHFSHLQLRLLFLGCLLLVFLATSLNRLAQSQLIHSWFIPLYVYGYFFFHTQNLSSSSRLHLTDLFSVLLLVVGRFALRLLIQNHDAVLSLRGAHFLAALCNNGYDFLLGLSLYLALRKIFANLSPEWFSSIWNFSDRCSYSIYLTHMLGILLAFHIAANLPRPIQACLAVATSISCGWLFHICLQIVTYRKQRC